MCWIPLQWTSAPAPAVLLRHRGGAWNQTNISALWTVCFFCQCAHRILEWIILFKTLWFLYEEQYEIIIAIISLEYDEQYVMFCKWPCTQLTTPDWRKRCWHIIKEFHFSFTNISKNQVLLYKILMTLANCFMAFVPGTLFCPSFQCGSSFWALTFWGALT